MTDTETAAPPRVGLVLAAGFGSRLSELTGEPQLKPLTEVYGTPLIVRVLDSLAVAGCSRAVLVSGYNADVFERMVRDTYRGELDPSFVVNHRYQLKNGVSVLAAREAVDGTFLMTMADHVFGDSVMKLAGAHRPPARGATLLIDRKLDTIFDMADATKVKTRDGAIVDIGKELTEYDCIDTGAFVCTDALFDALAAVYAEKGDASLSEGVAKLAQAGRMRVLDIGDGVWQDVDTPEMLAHAERVLAGHV